MNRFQQWAVRAAAWINPALRKLLNSAGGTVERLEEQNHFYRTLLGERQAEIRSRQDELREAIALAGGGWLMRNQESGRLETGIRESDSTAVVKCKEYLAELELALEDRGWVRDIAISQFEFSRYGIQQIILISRLYYLKNPLIRRGVDVSADYVFGRGVEVSSPDKSANEQLQRFFDNPENMQELSHVGLTAKERRLFTDGNNFLAFFTDQNTGEVIIRSIESLEIEEIVCDPNDASTPWYFHRRWMEQVFEERSGVISYKSRSEWYIAFGQEDRAAGATIQGKPLFKDQTGQFVPILQRKDGAISGWKFGCPLVYPALDWARAYKSFLENWASITAALARFAWQVETTGGIPAIAAFKQTLATTLATGGGWNIEQNPPPVTASAFVSGPGNKLTPVGTKGQTTEPEQGRRVLLMVAAALGLPETFFGDASVGSLATSQSLDRPTELRFLQRQEAWRETLQMIAHYVLDRSLKAPNGKLREAVQSRGMDPAKMTIVMAKRKDGVFVIVREALEKRRKDKITIDVKFPSILEHDITARVTAIVEAMTINGFECTGIDERTGIGLLLAELGVEDVDAVLEAMYPEAEYTSNVKQRDQENADAALAIAAKQQALKPPETGPGNAAGAAPPGMRSPKAKRAGLAAKESDTTALAVIQLTKALKKLQANGHA